MKEQNVLEGKKIFAIGDSMIQGHSLSDADNQTWLSKIAVRNHMTRENHGMNGAALSYNDLFDGMIKAEDSVVARFQALSTDADYIIIYAGTNDICNCIPMGDDSCMDKATFRGALHLLCRDLVTRYADRKFGFITPYAAPNAITNWENAPKYVDSILSVCAQYHIPVFDNHKNGGIDWSNPKDLASYTLGDMTHLNESGMEYISYRYEEFIRSL